MTYRKIRSAFPGLLLYFYLYQWNLSALSVLFIYSSNWIFMDYICLKTKWSFPELNPDATNSGAGGKQQGNTNHLLASWWKTVAFPLDCFARCAAIFVLLTLISTYEALSAAEVPVVIIFFKTQPFSLGTTNSYSLSASLQTFTDLSLVWNSMYYISVCNLITNLICLLPHCVTHLVHTITSAQNTLRNTQVTIYNSSIQLSSYDFLTACHMR